MSEADVDLGNIVRIEKTTGPRGKKWLGGGQAGLADAKEPDTAGEQLIEVFGAEDATVGVKLEGERGARRFSLGEAFHKGRASDASGKAKLQVLGQKRQWMKVIVRDSVTGQPTPVRLHLSGSRGEYIAPHGHHSNINTGWFMD